MSAWLRRILLAVLLLTALALYIEGNLTEVTLSLAQAKARTLAVTVLNETVEQVVQEGIRYDTLIHVTRDEQGQVRLLQADAAAMNHLAARVSALAQEKLDATENRAVQVPLGSALGLTLFAGAGPKLRVQVLPVGAIAARFDTEFQAAGINQTRHRILLTMTATVKLVIPTGAKTVEATTQVAMAESIIVGEVPETFTDVGNDMDMLDLVP